MAALLYHDGRRCLVNALKLLLTAKTGMSWALELDQQITQAVDKCAEKLFNDGRFFQGVTIPKFIFFISTF